MAHELFTQTTIGKTVYAVLRNNSTGQAYKIVTGVGSLETFNSANWGSYAIALTEIGSCGMYDAALTPLPADATYDVVIYTQVGGSASPSDTVISQGAIWILGGAIVGRQVNLTAVYGVNLSQAKVPATLGSTDYTGNTPQTGDNFLIGNNGTYGNAALAALIAAVGSGSSAVVTVTGPVISAKEIELVRGDSYSSASARQLGFNSSDWPSLAGATVVFSAFDILAGQRPISGAPASVITPTGVEKVDVPLTAGQTGLLIAGRAYLFDLVATLANGDRVTLTRGDLTVLQNATP